MAYRQKYTPNVKIKGQRGWCLKYVDDAGRAPSRTPNAATALATERRAKRIRTSVPPKGIWVVGFLDLRSGSYAAYDHVFLMKYLGNGRYEIRDSETASGYRSVYTSIHSILAWFGNYNPVYAGWSTHCDGRQYVEVYAPKPPKKKSSTTIAKEVLAGKWGNDPQRSKKLKAAGYNPATIQALVNKLVKPSKKPATKKYYIVKRGDTVGAICKKYGISLATFKKLNPSVRNVNMIYPGQKLRVK